ncbi:energy transducer TonB [Tsuneonella sp. CC-YZS046]|uniref:energy transducer TonB n=1 Tax=Tsuneonella sp. CC-YZS046 TaxID=3042152 RepID=UPI002D78927E|nr:energy transducer TonB [Tsuneonella sp. CC-YZS046]WRO65844.1 energy transducer TonB [Tsuneonella sp. CC-YZS046]
MAYADQQMSGNRIIALIIVALVHVALGYALVTGLAFEAVKQVAKRVTTIDIEEEKKPEEPPPPPPEQKNVPPPPVAPPPPISINTKPPEIVTTVTPPPPAPIVLAPPPPAAPPPPRVQPKSATPKGNPGSWATPDDYPSRALREDREGVARFQVSVGPDGRVTGCSITGSSGHADLDDATCKLVTRRARFNPATDGDGEPTTGTYSNAVRWQIPK